MENISAAAILDAALITGIIVSVIIGARRGLVKTVWKMGAWLIMIIFIITLKTPFTSMLAQTDAAEELYASISEKVTPVFTDSLYSGEATRDEKKEIADVLRLPRGVVSQVLNDYDTEAVTAGTQTAITRAADNIARSITMTIIGFAAAVILFILVKIAMFITYRILDAFSKLPVIHTANRTLGALWGFLSAILIIYIICAAIGFAAADNSDIYRMMTENYIVKYFYNYNILLQLFMKA